MIRSLVVAISLTGVTLVLVPQPAAACMAGPFPDSPYPGGLVKTAWDTTGGVYDATAYDALAFACGQQGSPFNPAITQIVNLVCHVMIGENCFN
jgi:hypothetical protein